MVETLKVWQCVGCGRIDHPQPCVGICQDRKVEIVLASDYMTAASRIAQLEALLRRIASTTPRAGQWEPSFRAMQDQARSALASTGAKSFDPEALSEYS